jgi:hypothetical protein
VQVLASIAVAAGELQKMHFFIQLCLFNNCSAVAAVVAQLQLAA